MKKRLLATVLAVAMMGTLAACGNGTKTDSAGNDANSSKTEQVSSEAEQSGTDDSLQRVLDAACVGCRCAFCRCRRKLGTICV